MARLLNKNRAPGCECEVGRYTCGACLDEAAVRDGLLAPDQTRAARRQRERAAYRAEIAAVDARYNGGWGFDD